MADKKKEIILELKTKPPAQISRKIGSDKKDAPPSQIKAKSSENNGDAKK